MDAIFQDYPQPLAIVDLVPTQATVGLREVEIRRRRWRQKDPAAAEHYLSSRRVPVVMGPGNRLYMIDRHHMARALYEEGVSDLPISIVENMRRLSHSDFWTILERRNWTHPFDDEGRRCAFEHLPSSIDKLSDDPFRSLAGALKRAGGYAKNKIPFSEFRWADFLRKRIDRALVERDFARSLAIAMDLSHGGEAAALPGWQRHQEG